MKSIIKALCLIVGTLGISTIVIGVIDYFKEKNTSHVFYGPYEKFIKRPMDFFLSSFSLIILSPALITVAVLVRVKIGSPVLFAQDRPGKEGKIFKIYKFRSMTDERDAEGNLLPDEIRLTEFGKKLRATSIDELPGLLSIVRGDMAIIGPRPLLTEYLDIYPKEYLRRHSVRPGLELPPPEGRNFFYTWREQFEQDIWYTEHISFLVDLRMIIRTIKMVIDVKNNKVRTNALRPKYNRENIDYNIMEGK